MDRPTFLKAIVAFLVSGSGAFAVAAADNSIVLGEWAFVGATAIASAGAVFGIRNGEDDA